MRRPVLGVALLLGALAATAQGASTAGNSLPATSTAVHRATTITGATQVSMKYTIAGGKITGVEPRVRGVSLLTKSVTARFGSDSAVVCTAGLLTVLDALTSLGEATYTCTSFLERADRPRPLVVSVS